MQATTFTTILNKIDMEGYKKNHLYFASESVGEGHPDKLCD